MWLTLRWLIGERLQNPVICVSPWARHDDLLSDYRLKGEALTTASAAVCVCVCVCVCVPARAVYTKHHRLIYAQAGVELPSLLLTFTALAKL